ncbi:MAG: hypothetical protein Q7T89_02055 [Anaerolineales bacterium]|jgi:hypothetical protein|nr:hypothetical protein [Anaerolineales bacterium]
MTTYPEIESELHRKSIVEEMDAIRLEEEAVKGKTLLDKNLALLGNLMVSAGEKLRRRYHSSQEVSSVKLVNKVA